MRSVYLSGRLTVALCAGFLVSACSDITAPAPIAPTDVTATLLSPTSVQLSWTPRPAAEKVAKYVVYRNGIRVAETAANSFVESGFAENVTLNYAVSSEIESGYETAQSTPVRITTRDVTPPAIIQNFPVNGAGPLNVDNTLVTLVFNEPMDSASINATTFTLKVGPTGEAIPGTIQYLKRDNVAEFRASHTMPPSTTIVVTAAGMKDLAGNALGSPYTFSFKTTENLRPFVVSIFPADNSVGVPLDAEIRIQFNEAMDQSTLGFVRVFDLLPGQLPDLLAARGSWDAATNTLMLRVGFKSKHRYSVVVGWSFPLKDLAGNTLTGPTTFTFTTLDAGPPVPIAYTPVPDAVNVDPATPIRITFNEPLDASTVTSSNVRVYRFDGGGAVAGVLSYDEATNTIAYAPSSPLASGTKYVVFITNLKDATGVSQEDAVSLIFTTR